MRQRAGQTIADDRGDSTTRFVGLFGRVQAFIFVLYDITLFFYRYNGYAL